MEENLEKFEYSRYFNYLFYLGMWSYDTNNMVRWRLYVVYQMFACFAFGLSISLQSVDLWRSIGDIEKIAYNMSTSTFSTGIGAKVLVFLPRSKCLNKLRLKLWKDYRKIDGEEWEDLKKRGLKTMKIMDRVFHGAALMFYPVCMVLAFYSDYWGPRELPFPAYFPIDFDESVVGYNITFSVEVFCGLLILFTAIEIDLSLYSLIIQMSIQYKILNQDIINLSELYEELDDETNDSKKREINYNLRKTLTQHRIKKVVKRQITLAKYADMFEYGYNSIFLINVIGGTILLIMNGLQVMSMSLTFNQKLVYEVVFLTVIIVDLFFSSLFVTRLTTQCESLAEAVYSTSWYSMDTDLQRDILMILIRAQRPPKFTAGKLMIVDLNTFLLLLRNSFSWLVLIQQLESS